MLAADLDSTTDLITVLQECGFHVNLQLQAITICSEEATSLLQKIYYHERPPTQYAVFSQQAHSLTCHLFALRIRTDNVKKRIVNAFNIAGPEQLPETDLQQMVLDVVTERDTVEHNLQELDQKLTRLRTRTSFMPEPPGTCSLPIR